MLTLRQQNARASVAVNIVVGNDAWAGADFQVDSASLPVVTEATVAEKRGIGDGIIGVVDVEPESRAGVFITRVADDAKMMGIRELPSAAYPRRGESLA